MVDSSAEKPDKPKDQDTVMVVVNGVETAVNIHGNPALSEVVQVALDQTKNSGQPLENWELRGPNSAPITDLGMKVKKLDLEPHDRLFLNLRAGIGG